jgi:hypothetical protein
MQRQYWCWGYYTYRWSSVLQIWMQNEYNAATKRDNTNKLKHTQQGIWHVLTAPAVRLVSTRWDLATTAGLIQVRGMLREILGTGGTTYCLSTKTSCSEWHPQIESQQVVGSLVTKSWPQPLPNYIIPNCWQSCEYIAPIFGSGSMEIFYQIEQDVGTLKQ